MFPLYFCRNVCRHRRSPFGAPHLGGISIVVVIFLLSPHIGKKVPHTKIRLVSTPGCVIHDENAFDAALLRSLETTTPTKCAAVKEGDRVVVNDGRALWVDVDAARRMNVVGCNYSRVVEESARQHWNRSWARVGTGLRSNVVYLVLHEMCHRIATGGIKPNSAMSRPMMFGRKVLPKATLVMVNCSTKVSNFSVLVWLKYRDPKLVAFKDATKRQRKLERAVVKPTSLINDLNVNTPQSSQPFNIHVIVLDSVSRLNSMRSLPLTRRIFKQMGAVEFYGYTKVACCSFGNAYPLLTGKHQNDGGYRIKDAIWSEMSREGFFTFASEDWIEPADGMYFNFTDLDYDWAPGIRTRYSTKNESFYCHDGKTASEALYNWLETIVATHRHHGDTLFTLTWPTIWAHDQEKGLVYADRPTHQLLQRMKEAGDLERSVLFFLGDHGPKWGNITDTPVGQYEMRHPQAFFLAPEWFRLQFPKLLESAFINAHRLTTHFDVHATLRHLLHLQTRTTPWRNEGVGLSLFTEIPANRTCADASIPDLYCGCRTPVDVMSADAAAAGDAIAAAVNAMTASRRRFCVEWRLAEIVTIQKREDEWEKIFWLVVRLTESKTVVSPCSAVFSGVVSRFLGRSLEVKHLEPRDDCAKKFCVKPK